MGLVLVGVVMATAGGFGLRAQYNFYEKYNSINVMGWLFYGVFVVGGVGMVVAGLVGSATTDA